MKQWSGQKNLYKDKNQVKICYCLIGPVMEFAVKYIFKLKVENKLSLNSF